MGLLLGYLIEWGVFFGGGPLQVRSSVSVMGQSGDDFSPLCEVRSPFSGRGTHN